jgi:hypothetical protein
MNTSSAAIAAGMYDGLYPFALELGVEIFVAIYEWGTDERWSMNRSD